MGKKNKVPRFQVQQRIEPDPEDPKGHLSVFHLDIVHVGPWCKSETITVKSGEGNGKLTQARLEAEQYAQSLTHCEVCGAGMNTNVVAGAVRVAPAQSY